MWFRRKTVKEKIAEMRAEIECIDDMLSMASSVPCHYYDRKIQLAKKLAYLAETNKPNRKE